MIRLQAHQGACRTHPGNTMPAYKAALEQGYQIIELDPKFTKDQVCVLLHDWTVNRTGRDKDGNKLPVETKIADLTLAEAMELDFGVAYDEKYKGTKIPLFTEVIEFAKENKIYIKVDNVVESFTPEQIDAIIALVHENNGEEYISFTCKSVEFVARVAKEFPNSEIHYDGPVSREIMDSIRSVLKNNKLTTWLPSEKKSWLPYPPADKETVAMVHEYGEVGVWTARDEESLKACLALEPDAIEVDGIVTPEMINKKEV